MKTQSSFKLGWVGIRASKVGRSSRLLLKLGYMRQHHSGLNNRNGFDWVRPCRTREQFSALDWRALAAAGLCGQAIWFADAQWGHNSGITEAQWQDRRMIDAEFNAQWPTGTRTA